MFSKYEMSDETKGAGKSCKWKTRIPMVKSSAPEGLAVPIQLVALVSVAMKRQEHSVI